MFSNGEWQPPNERRVPETEIETDDIHSMLSVSALGKPSRMSFISASNRHQNYGEDAPKLARQLSTGPPPSYASSINSVVARSTIPTTEIWALSSASGSRTPPNFKPETSTSIQQSDIEEREAGRPVQIPQSSDQFDIYSIDPPPIELHGRHLRNGRGQWRGSRYTCYCGKEFPGILRSIERHQESCPEAFYLLRPTKWFKCEFPQCSKSYAGLDNLLVHKGSQGHMTGLVELDSKDMNYDDRSSIYAPDNTLEPLNNFAASEMFKCDFPKCGNSYTRPDSLLVSHHKQYPVLSLLSLTGDKTLMYRQAHKRIKKHDSVVTSDLENISTSPKEKIHDRANGLYAAGDIPPYSNRPMATENNMSNLWRRSARSTMLLYSTQSIFSQASAIATSDASSIPQTPENLIERLVSLLLNDAIIHSLCSKALESIVRERFERNLKKLLKNFAISLRREAESEDQRNTARFVLHRATNSAHLICNQLKQSREAKKLFVEEEGGQAEEFTEDSHSDDSETFDTLQYLDDFIRESRAIDALRNDLRDFVEQNAPEVASNHKRPPFAADPNPNTTQDEAELKEVDLSLKEVRKGFYIEKYHTVVNKGVSVWRILAHFTVETTVWTWGVASLNFPFQCLQDFLSEGSQTISLKLKLARPPFEPGKKRIEWRCKCGHLLYDDFIEMSPGAAERFRRQKTIQNTQPSSSSSRTNSTVGIFSWMSATIRPIMSPAKQNPGLTLPLHERGHTSPNTGNVGTSNQQPSPPIALLYLLLCYNEGRYATCLLQIDLTSKGAECDKSLFRLLRSIYHDMRGKIISRLSLRNLQSIKFVSFELFGKELVNLRKQDDIPPPDHTEYHYQPAPPELIPPVGENCFMHLFEHPEEGENVSFCLDRFPKKLHEKLLCRGGGTNAGWGLQFVEGWNMRKVFGSVFFLFEIGSLLIAILYTVYEHSIQDAFSMASYMMAMATMGIGTLQAFINS
ncbi:hypothetical protein HYALB_00007756 [Hymenoscyphus albidus]|uniref:C2H2-type domain-containing protein n=1 Tax=Hymenoscyphus albidus TaxID=595503 RepID=A0A9N9LS43_9HELO|nr:hypothetical protein HYALB_00007756 [Hymenoscyphus albidus]